MARKYNGYYGYGVDAIVSEIRTMCPMARLRVAYPQADVPEGENPVYLYEEAPAIIISGCNEDEKSVLRKIEFQKVLGLPKQMRSIEIVFSDEISQDRVG